VLQSYRFIHHAASNLARGRKFGEWLFEPMAVEHRPDNLDAAANYGRRRRLVHACVFRRGRHVELPDFVHCLDYQR
jgi:hypothetical protein